jgi:hypothetical protein
MKPQPPRAGRPLPLQVPSAFLRVRAGKETCGRTRTGKGRSCARSHRVSRV